MSTAVPSTPPAIPVATPECPFCRTGEVVTVGKVVTQETYWRCRGCGQIWNPLRLNLAPPPDRRRW
jgi:transposase-like protein